MQEFFILYFDLKKKQLFFPLAYDSRFQLKLPSFDKFVLNKEEAQTSSILKLAEKIIPASFGLTTEIHAQGTATFWVFVGSDWEGGSPVLNRPSVNYSQLTISPYLSITSILQRLLKTHLRSSPEEALSHPNMIVFRKALQWCRSFQERSTTADHYKQSIKTNTLPTANVVKLTYNAPLALQLLYTAQAKTSQTKSLLRIQNKSTDYALTTFVEPDPSDMNLYHIPANDPRPVYIINNWNGSILSVSNVSQEDSTAELFLAGQ